MGQKRSTRLSVSNLQPGDDHGTVLVEGNDFYSTPRLSPDGTQLAWLTWNHPNMPWDGCELWVGEFAEDGTLASTRWVAGGAAESIFQPEWSPDGVLYFASDSSGWWNLERIYGRWRDRKRLPVKGRTGHAAMGFRHVVLCFCFAGNDRLQSHRSWCFHVSRRLDTAHGQVNADRLSLHRHSVLRAREWPGRISWWLTD